MYACIFIVECIRTQPLFQNEVVCIYTQILCFVRLPCPKQMSEGISSWQDNQLWPLYFHSWLLTFSHEKILLNYIFNLCKGLEAPFLQNVKVPWLAILVSCSPQPIIDVCMDFFVFFPGRFPPKNGGVAFGASSGLKGSWHQGNKARSYVVSQPWVKL